MKNILVINASARTARSKSRMLTDAFVEQWKTIYGDAFIRFRDLGYGDTPHVNEEWIIASSKPVGTRSAQEIDALKKSDTYIDELREADIIVLGSPMYNWSIPSSLKAWIDQVVRVNETWKFNQDNIGNPYTGLLKNKILVMLLSRGGRGYEKGEPNEHMNFQSTYLKAVFNIIGITNIYMTAINGESMDPRQLKESIDTSLLQIKELIGSGIAQWQTSAV